MEIAWLQVFVAALLAGVLNVPPCHGVPTLKNGYYKNIVVELSEDVTFNGSCSEFLGNVEKLFNETSSILYSSLDNGVVLEEFHIVVPPSWDRPDCERSFAKVPLAKPDIHIGSSHPVYGNRPWTQQTSTCGKPGDYISVGSSFFTEDSDISERGHSMMRQWARYQYGIFDDTSCLNDSNFKSEFCSSSQSGVVDAKHVKMCRTTNSPRDLITEVLGSTNSIPKLEPNFYYEVKTLPRIVFAFNKTIQEDWQPFRYGWRVMLDYLPAEIRTGNIVYDDNSIEMDYSVLPLGTDPSSFNEKLAVLGNDGRTIKAAEVISYVTKEANDMMESVGGNEGKSLVIITGELKASDLDVLLETIDYALSRQLAVSVVAVGLNSESARYPLMLLTEKTNGTFVEVPLEKNALEMRIKIEDALVSVVKFQCGSLAEQMLTTTFFKRLNITSNSIQQVDFSVATDHRDVKFQLYKNVDDNAGIGEPTISASAKADCYPVLSKLTSNGDLPWLYTYRVDLFKPDCTFIPGNWTVTFDGNSTEPMYARVIARTKQRTPTIDFEIRPMHFDGTDYHQLIASVQMNGLPVLDAEVKVSIRSLTNETEIVDYNLADNGKFTNFSDITRNDGVYSRRVLYTSGQAVAYLTVTCSPNKTFTVPSSYSAPAFTTWDSLNIPEDQRQYVTESFNMTVMKTLDARNSDISPVEGQETTVSPSTIQNIVTDIMNSTSSKPSTNKPSTDKKNTITTTVPSTNTRTTEKTTTIMTTVPSTRSIPSTVNTSRSTDKNTTITTTVPSTPSKPSTVNTNTRTTDKTTTIMTTVPNTPSGPSTVTTSTRTTDKTTTIKTTVPSTLSVPSTVNTNTQTTDKTTTIKTTVPSTPNQTSSTYDNTKGLYTTVNSTVMNTVRSTSNKPSTANKKKQSSVTGVINTTVKNTSQTSSGDNGGKNTVYNEIDWKIVLGNFIALIVVIGLFVLALCGLIYLLFKMLSVIKSQK